MDALEQVPPHESTGEDEQLRQFCQLSDQSAGAGDVFLGDLLYFAPGDLKLDVGGDDGSQPSTWHTAPSLVPGVHDSHQKFPI
ncbi:hypothetical protein OAF21_07805 [Akkermansiaceae bacterium]|nr:hypothetical protein [Akkermansiaceae bacterium]MDB4282427.1 hypothetical protein [Akkermansiaceae bacterium]MDB4693493.1 hypothetical protein [Akkermansiaceae bacterium]